MWFDFFFLLWERRCVRNGKVFGARKGVDVGLWSGRCEAQRILPRVWLLLLWDLAIFTALNDR